jgi:hypothetical protein
MAVHCAMMAHPIARLLTIDNFYCQPGIEAQSTLLLPAAHDLCYN